MSVNDRGVRIDENSDTASVKYRRTRTAKFLRRPNRFIAHVEVDGAEEVVHVKNTGRCKELLLPGIPVILEESDNPARKTRYDLVSVWKENLGWVNIDSQMPNKLAGLWLSRQGFDYIKPEYTYGQSRIDFYMEKGKEKYLMEVKGCTLEIDGTGYFPDAPTERGVKHLHELIQAQKDGYHAAIAFVIQMNGITEVRPNMATHPEFGTALNAARKAGVEVFMIPCRITEDEVFV
ncbi:MAG: DNA/RNA nuclease SfsA [Clostridiales bacterium]|nr:DNA/RNA nuclease SfsA [Candidatus Blautia equi]